MKPQISEIKQPRKRRPLLPGYIFVAAGLLMGISVLGIMVARDFREMHRSDLIYPSPGLTAEKKLSDYFPKLTGSPGDTSVFIFSGEEGGGHILVTGGTHPNEPAGFLSALLLVENISVKKGKLVIIPQSNRSGFSHNDPFEGNPQGFAIPTSRGPRRFRYGSRLTNPAHQWPDPTLYINPQGQRLAGAESRNLNRAYPGKADGNLTEKVAFGIMCVIREEGIDIGIDLHEAAPEYPVINAIVFHENSAELAAMTFMELQLADLEFRLEESPPSLRGLSHREWGDDAGIQAFLFETANASHGRLKGKPSADLILQGKDPNYVRAARMGRLFVSYDEDGIPLRQRVSRHMASIRAVVASWKELEPDKTVEIEGLPDPEDVAALGMGQYLDLP